MSNKHYNGKHDRTGIGFTILFAIKFTIACAT